MTPITYNLLGMTMGQISKYKQAQEMFKQKVLDDWDKTIKMPRKMKKKRRKELELEWRIACYDPFNIDEYF